MDFLIDVHLPISLSKFLDRQTNCTSIHINQILQKWHTSDADICKHADLNNLVVITKDADFKNSYLINRTPKKIIRIALGNISNTELLVVIEKYLPFILPLAIKNNFYIELNHEQINVTD